MRLLIYGMQSSGASALAALLGQRPRSAAFIDIWAMYAAPALTGPDSAVAKVVVTTAFPLSLHQDRFRPDKTILVLRHPDANFRSLSTKPYRNHCGFIEEKFAILEETHKNKSSYDLIVYYEDLAFNPVGILNTFSDLGWPCDAGYLDFPRSRSEIVGFNEKAFPSIRERLEYGTGNYRGERIDPRFACMANLPDKDSAVSGWCPQILLQYRELIQKNRRRWSLNETPVIESSPLAPQLVIGSDSKKITAKAIRFDQMYSEATYRHLDISVFDMTAGSEKWPHVKFKFCVDKGVAHLEFRESTGWPKIFTELRAAQWDDFGLVLRLNSQGFAAVRTWRSTRDQLLIQAILKLLPGIVKLILEQSDLKPGERAAWLTEGEHFADTSLSMMDANVRVTRTKKGGANPKS